MRMSFPKKKMASNKVKSRGKMWSDEATRLLIELWSEETIQFSLQNCKTSKETGQVYKTLLVKLHGKGYTDFTVKEVISKIKKLRQKYKSVKDQKRRSGNSANPKKEWKFFKQIDKFLCTKHNISPPFIVDTSAESEYKDKDDSCIDKLIQNYGHGEVTMRKCNTCDYEQPIRSDGVHENGGAVMVYAEADEFVCPNCTSMNVTSDGVESNVIIEDDQDDEKEEKTDKKDITLEKSTVITPKKKRKSNMEKSLESAFNHFKKSADEDFLRYQKLEDERVEKERQSQMQRMDFENDRRKEEREHEMNMLRLIMGSPPLPALHDVHPQSFLSTPVSYARNNTGNPHCSDTETNSLVYYQL